MKKAIAILLIIVIYLAYVAGANLFDNIKLTKEVTRLQNNNKAQNTASKQTRDNTGAETTIRPAEVYTISELKFQFDSLLNAIKQIGVKPKNIKSITEIHSETEKRIITTLRDSIIFTPRDTITARAINYSDKFYKVKGLILADTATLQVNSVDSLIQIVYLEKRIQFKPFRIKFKRQLIQQIRTANPANHITYNRQIEITK